jgi:SAM-dependent methyltransferase
MDPIASRVPYLLDNAGAEAPARLTALAALFDPGTIRHLESRGVGPGWHCLEVGGGGGSVAAWLAARVGPTGHVLVTDIDPRFLQALDLPDVEVRRHDIATDPLPESAFDVIHLRLVLNHLPEPARVLARLRTALKPGGWLVCEDFDSESMPPDPTVSAGELLLRTQVAMGRLMADRGFDRRFGRRLFAHLRAQGLADVGAEARLFMVQGGSAGADLVRANCEQLRSAMIDAGNVTAREIDQDLARLNEPQFMVPSSIMWAAWGRRIATDRE